MSAAIIDAARTLLAGLPAKDRASLFREFTPEAGAVKAAPAKVVKYSDAAERLGVTTRTIENLVARGQLRPVRGTGARALGVAEDSLTKFIAGEA